MPIRQPPPTGLLEGACRPNESAPAQAESRPAKDEPDNFENRCLCVKCDLIELCFVGRAVAEAYAQNMFVTVSACARFMSAGNEGSDSVAPSE